MEECKRERKGILTRHSEKKTLDKEEKNNESAQEASTYRNKIAENRPCALAMPNDDRD